MSFNTIFAFEESPHTAGLLWVGTDDGRLHISRDDGGSWDEIPFPGLGDPHAYALEVSGESMAPVYRDGDIVIISPSASIRRGDRVVVRTRTGEVLVKQLLRHSARRIDLQSLNPTHEDRSLDVDDVVWMSRVVWVSQ